MREPVLGFVVELDGEGNEKLREECSQGKRRAHDGDDSTGGRGAQAESLFGVEYPEFWLKVLVSKRNCARVRRAGRENATAFEEWLSHCHERRH